MSTGAQCQNCKYYLGRLRCEAFPERIPYKILNGEHDHEKPYKNDNGYRFKAIVEEK